MAKNTKNLVERIVDLPTLPQVVTTLINLLDNPRSSVKDISTVMGNDPALVAKLLKIVNSAFYSLPKRVSNVPQAVAILGYNTIKAFAISASVFDVFAGGNPDFPHSAFWVHSLGTGTIARHLASSLPRPPPAANGEAVPRPNPDTAFVAGLLHGIGKLILDQYAQEEFCRVIDAARDHGRSFHDAERDSLADGYATVGYWLMQRWQMPEDIQLPVLHHLDPAGCPAPYRGLAAAISLGSYFCRAHGYGNAGDFCPPWADPAALAVFGLTPEALPELEPRVAEEFQKADVFFALLQS